METNNYSVVARKHDIPSTTVYTWIQRDKDQFKIQKSKKQKDLEKELADTKRMQF